MILIGDGVINDLPDNIVPIDVNGFWEMIQHDNFFILRANQNTVYRASDIYCSSCSAKRKMDIRLLHVRYGVRQVGINSMFPGGTTPTLELMNPTLLSYKCSQCNNDYTVLFYKGSEGNSLLMLPSQQDSFATPNTPEAVKYYLGQAFKSYSVAAFSASVAMFGTALEHILYEFGYNERMLGKKIEMLKKDKKEKNLQAPKWVLEIEEEYLDVINKLGCGARHVNDGDIKKQSILDTEMVNALKDLFIDLLDVIYEKPIREKTRKAKLDTAASILKSRS